MPASAAPTTGRVWQRTARGSTKAYPGPAARGLRGRKRGAPEAELTQPAAAWSHGGVPAAALSQPASGACQLVQGLLGLAGSGPALKALLGALATASAIRLSRRGSGRIPGTDKRRRVAMVDDGEGGRLSLVTFNIRGISDRWPERLPLLRACLAELDADVYAFQEVLTGEFGQEADILGKGYHVHGCRAALGHLLRQGGVAGLYARWLQFALRFSCLRHMMVKMPLWVEAWREAWRVQATPAVLLRDLAMAPFFGNSLASSLPATYTSEDDQLWLGEFRAAQRICVMGPLLGASPSSGEAPGSETGVSRQGLWIVNTHLHHDEEKPGVRTEQVDAICRWMEKVLDSSMGVLIVGDLNAHPREEVHAVFSSFGYRSAYDSALGMQEPPITWPSGLVAPLMDQGEPMCLDYVYFKGGPAHALELLSMKLAGDAPCQGDATLYPSDHFGLHAVVQIKPRAAGPAM
eukprot:jgi/Tetstr1/438052/TSEL_026678.t1